MRLRLTADAEAEPIEIEAGYRARRRGLEAEFLRAFDAGWAAIARLPGVQPPFHRGARRTRLRRLPQVVVYVVRGGENAVGAAYHSSRDPRGLRRRLR